MGVSGPPHRTHGFARSILAVALAASAPALARAQETDSQHGRSPYLDAAIDAAKWIRSHAIETEHGLVWPVAPADQDAHSDPLPLGEGEERSEPGEGAPSQHSYTLYSGTPGVVLFLLELHRATDDESYLRDAQRGGDELIAHLDEIAASDGTGLYVGIAGVGFALWEVFRQSRDMKYRLGADRCVELIRAASLSADPPRSWSEGTDIISGLAGAGLFLLYMSERRDDGKDPNWSSDYLKARALLLAREAARRLIESGQMKHGGIWWEVSPGFRNSYPNFSHGTAGVGFFFATQYQMEPRGEFLKAALGAARYLTTIADTQGEVCLVPRFDPDEYDEGEPHLHYISWCHGPAGTGQFFHRLWEVTGDEQWREWRDRSGRALLQSGVPENRLPGFWNNVGRCCGNVGVAEFALSMHATTGEEAYLDLARRLTEDLLARATRVPPSPPAPLAEGEGSDRSMLKWIHAEHRVQPDNLAAQTGLMQGAAGIGLWLLRLDAYERGREWTLRLPDSPW